MQVKSRLANTVAISIFPYGSPLRHGPLCFKHGGADKVGDGGLISVQPPMKTARRGRPAGSRDASPVGLPPWPVKWLPYLHGAVILAIRSGVCVAGIEDVLAWMWWSLAIPSRLRFRGRGSRNSLVETGRVP